MNDKSTAAHATNTWQYFIDGNKIADTSNAFYACVDVNMGV
ncbi:hypothetical protein AB0I94_13265 [Streptomyces sp. NPDC050147]